MQLWASIVYRLRPAIYQFFLTIYMYKYEEGRTEEVAFFTTNRGDTMRVTVVYPKKNPPGIRDAITTALTYAGVFERIGLSVPDVDNEE